MEADVVSAFIHVVIENVINIMEKAVLEKEMSNKLVFRKEMSLINGLKYAQELVNLKLKFCSLPSDSMDEWLKKLGAVVLYADNLLDELNYHSHSIQINISKPCTDSTKLLPYSILYRRKRRSLDRTFYEINQKVESLNHMALSIAIQNHGHAFTDEPYGRDIPESFSGDGVYVGRDDDLQELADMLITITEHEERVFSVLSIQGVGGIGKTTLARKLFDRENIKTRFGESRIWVDVGPVCDPTLLFMKILATFTSDRAESMEEILISLKQAFKGKTYLLVLDDIWINDVSRWEDFVNSMYGIMSTKGNSIITTTRSTWVAEVMRPFHIHQLKGLSEEQCWSIIKTITFGNLDVPSGLENIGREYAEICQGLPLAAKLVGGFLRGAS